MLFGVQILIQFLITIMEELEAPLPHQFSILDQLLYQPQILELDIRLTVGTPHLLAEHL